MYCLSAQQCLTPPCKRRYRSLASVYHPDKHRDPELKKRAVQSFTRIQAAYEVRDTHTPLAASYPQHRLC